MTIALTGNDTHVINGRILSDFSTVGDVVIHEFDDDLVTVKKGKNGNTIYAFNYQGQICKSTYKVLRGSPDDIFLQQLESLFEQNPPAFSLLTGESQKVIGDGASNILGDQLVLSGGIFKKRPGMKENVDGEAEQAEAVYEILWGNAPRNIG